MAEKKSIEKELESTKTDLADLEMFIREFSTFLPLGVLTVNPNEVIINVNKVFEELTEFKTIEIIGKPFQTIFKEKEKLRQILKEVKEKEKATKELTLVSKQKKEIPVSTSFLARKDKEGNFIGYFIGVIDITEFKKLQIKVEEKVKGRTEELEKSREALMNIAEDAEEARRRAEEEKEKTLTIITNFTDGLLVFDLENKLALINPRAEDFFGVQGSDIIGRTILELNTFPGIEPLVRLVGEEIKGVFRKELPIKEGLTLEVSTVPMISREEKLGTIVVLHDVTREKMIEKMKSEFVSLSAHQLRTPLSAVKWTLKMLLDGDLGEITEEQRDFIEKTYQSNERMINLINALLDVTRIEEGRFLYKPILTNLESVVQFVINSCKEEIERKKIEFEFIKPKKKLPRVILDVEKMRLAIQNLLENAIRYTEPGGRVTVSLKSGKKEIGVLVKDTGIGIPKDQQERVFTKFFRGANVIRIATEGSGLGLFITKNIIEAHGGKIWFQSVENQGTTFYFTLPIKEEFGEFLKEF